MNTDLHTAGILQTKAYRVLQHRVNTCLQVHELNHGQWTMLGVVAEAGDGIRLNSTAEKLGVKAPLVTAMANEMIERGYLERIGHQRDRRAKLLTVSPAGLQVLENVCKELGAVLQQLLNGLSSKEMTVYKHILETIIANNQLMPR
jgi:MarR family transcriptional regulator for hemolysin